MGTRRPCTFGGRVGHWLPAGRCFSLLLSTILPPTLTSSRPRKPRRPNVQRLFRIIEELVKWENTTNERSSTRHAPRSCVRVMAIRHRFSIRSAVEARSRSRLNAWGLLPYGVGPEPRCRPDHQGSYRDPAEVCWAAAVHPDDGRLKDRRRGRSPGSRRGRPLLRQLDARAKPNVVSATSTRRCVARSHGVGAGRPSLPGYGPEPITCPNPACGAGAAA